jgi:putative FmdB family regulatory protein
VPLFDFKCNNEKCGHTEEFIVGDTVVDPIPDVCPVCKEGKLEKQFSIQRQSFDIIGSGCYMNDHGKHAWKKGKSAAEISDFLMPDPGSGRYKDPY